MNAAGRWARRVRAWLVAWLEAYVPLFRRRQPRVAVELGPWLPGWVLRCVPVAVVWWLALLLDGGPVVRFVAVLVAAAVFVWPSGPAPAVAMVGYALLVATAPEIPSSLVTAVLVAVLPAIMQIGAVLGRTGLYARVELAVFGPVLPRYVAIQLVVQPLALLGQWLAGQDVLSGPRWILLPMIAVLGLAGLSFAWLPRLRAQPSPDGPAS